MAACNAEEPGAVILADDSTNPTSTPGPCSSAILPVEPGYRTRMWNESAVETTPTASVVLKYANGNMNNTSSISNNTSITPHTTTSRPSLYPTPYVTVINVTLTPWKAATSTHPQTATSLAFFPTLTPTTSPIAPEPSLATVLSSTPSSPNTQLIIAGCSVGIGVLAALVGMLSFLLWRQRRRKAKEDHKDKDVLIAGRPYSDHDDDEVIVNRHDQSRDRYLPSMSQMGAQRSLVPESVPRLPPLTYTNGYGAARRGDEVPRESFGSDYGYGSSSGGSTEGRTAVRDFGKYEDMNGFSKAYPQAQQARMYRGSQGVEMMR